MASKPSIFILNTGGLITAKKMGRKWHPGLYTTEEFLKGLPKLKAIADIDTANLFRIDSAQMHPENWVTLANFVHSKIRKYDGVVILHGTDTMTYTASALSFMLQGTGKPIVLTGAQYAPDQIGSDAQRNTIDAVQVAANSGLGETVIVFNRKIFRGTRCVKVSDTDYDAFMAAGNGLLGTVEHEIRLEPHARTRKKAKPRLAACVEPNVSLIKPHPGFNAGAFECLVRTGAKGLVAETYWSTLPTQRKPIMDLLVNASRSMPVALTRDAMDSGCEHEPQCCEKKDAETLTCCKDMLTGTALAKLMWALSQARNPKKVRKIMQTNCAGEMSAR